jgi:hypothetical protein
MVCSNRVVASGGVLGSGMTPVGSGTGVAVGVGNGNGAGVETAIISTSMLLSLTGRRRLSTNTKPAIAANISTTITPTTAAAALAVFLALVAVEAGFFTGVSLAEDGVPESVELGEAFEAPSVLVASGLGGLAESPAGVSKANIPVP